MKRRDQQTRTRFTVDLARPEGLLRREMLLFSLLPLHLGIRQYWRNFESLEGWARSGGHAGWWRGFVQVAKGCGLWHETYFMPGGMEAIYGNVPPPLGFMGFAPVRPAEGAAFSARSRLNVAGEAAVQATVSPADVPRKDVPRG